MMITGKGSKSGEGVARYFLKGGGAPTGIPQDHAIKKSMKALIWWCDQQQETVSYRRWWQVAAVSMETTRMLQRQNHRILMSYPVVMLTKGPW